MKRKIAAKTFLLLPSMPTPNGRLHLGHIAGPFLRLDAASRYLRSRGHQVFFASGTDAYESYVIHHAQSEGIEPRQLAQKYTLGFKNDLAAFDIDYDIWLDPLSYPGRETYERHCRQLLQRLINQNMAKYQTTTIPFSTSQQQFIPRSYLAGKCPSCQSDVVGSLCEVCGRQFMAHEVIEPYFRPANSELPTEQLQWPKVNVLGLSLPKDSPYTAKIIAQVESLDIPSRHKQIVLNHVQNQAGFVELTVPGSYGIKWQGQTDTDEIIFSYSAVYSFFLATGEIVSSILETDKNAFAIDTDIFTISSYGSDIPIPWISMPTILSHLDIDANGQQQYGGFDYYWGNEFLCLHGSKFSTSRGHVIWASGLIEQTPVNADMARFYLATIDPAKQQTDFLIDGLVDNINHIVIDEIYHAVNNCIQQCPFDTINAPSQHMTKALNQVFDQQDSCFEASQFHLEKAAKVIQNWCKTWHQNSNKNPSDSYWFIKSLAIISYPIMPNFAHQLWHNLGATDIPNMQGFYDKTMPTETFEVITQHISQQDIYPCLPDTLNHLTQNSPHQPDTKIEET